MTITEIYTMLRNQTQTTSGNVSDETLLPYLNVVYHDIENTIVDRVKEDYFWDVFTTDLVDDQNEYDLQNTATTTQGIKKVTRVEVLRASTDTDYQLLRQDSVNNYEYSDDYLQENTSKLNGWREMREDSLFLYPKPDASVTSGLKIRAIKSLIDLNNTDVAETYLFPRHTELRQYHAVIVAGMMPYILRHRDVANTALIEYYTQSYERMKQQMVDELNEKYVKPVDWNLPSMEYYY